MHLRNQSAKGFFFDSPSFLRRRRRSPSLLCRSFVFNLIRLAINIFPN
ncbi:unnamed protein product [Brassica napus]|uniref:(rape) hypothetical protein n=1 Tax=Brassica napus TaxID=3708 RepID=A0A816T9Q0_BRANA|nr:unnamed protein product [Brassica napus]